MGISISVLLLVLISGFSWSGLDTIRKILANRLEAPTIVAWLALGQIPFFLIWVLLTPDFSVQTGFFYAALPAVGLNAMANYLFIRSVQLSPLSQTIPFLAFTPLFTIVAAMPLGEMPTTGQALGILLVVAGAFFLNPLPTEKGRTTWFRSRWRAFLFEPGSVLMSLVAVLWSMTGPLDKVAMSYSAPSFHGLFQCTGVGLCFLFITLKRHDRPLPEFRKNAPLLFVMLLFAATAFGFQLLSIQRMPVSLFEAIKRAIGMSMAMFLGRLIFKERFDGIRIVACAIMMVGVGLILLN